VADEGGKRKKKKTTIGITLNNHVRKKTEGNISFNITTVCEQRLNGRQRPNFTRKGGRTGMLLPVGMMNAGAHEKGGRRPPRTTTDVKGKGGGKRRTRGPNISGAGRRPAPAESQKKKKRGWPILPRRKEEKRREKSLA